ncbi:MAG: hypothetical protein V1872_05245 [bacterium]
MLKNKFAIISICLILAGVIGYNLWFFSSQDKPPLKTISNNPPTPPPVPIEGKKENLLVESPSVFSSTDPAKSNPADQEEAEKKTEEVETEEVEEIDLDNAEWGVDPFQGNDLNKPLANPNNLLPGLPQKQEKTGPKELRKTEGILKTRDFKVGAVIITESRRLAIINNKIVHEGEKIGDILIKSVTPSQVEVVDSQQHSLILEIKDKSDSLASEDKGSLKLDNLNTRESETKK